MEEQTAAQRAPQPSAGAADERAAAAHPHSAPPPALVAHERGTEVRLTRDEAEQVIRRALELQDTQQTGRDPGLSLADVADIAHQLGVDPSLVRRARSEVQVARQGDEAPYPAQRLLGPGHVAAARLVPGDSQPVRTAAAAWMTNDEGMTRVGRRGHTERWVRDKRLLVQLRRGLQADRGSGVLRDLDAVSVTITPDPEGAIVAVDADTSRVRTAGGVITAMGTVISAGIGAGVAAMVPDSGPLAGDAVQFGAAFIPSMAVGLGTTVAVTRTWTTKVRRAVEQALDGIAMTTTSPQLPAPPIRSDTGLRGTVLRWLGGGG